MEKEKIKTIEAICEDALVGNITLEELNRRWPEEAKGISPLEEVFSDLTDGITHTPGFWFKKGINHELWQKTWEYKLILCDLCLLPFLSNVSEWRGLRDDLAKSLPADRGAIQDEIRKRLDGHDRR